MSSGFQYELREVNREDLEDAILSANADSSVDGIMVYYPIFGARQDQYLQQVVDVNKDVEGLTHKYVSNMYRNVRFLDDAQQCKSILPCTPLAVVKILEHLQIYNPILPYGNRLHGRTITVINRSEVVGRPLAALLANDGARVYSKDVDDVQLYHRGEGLRKRKHEVEDKPGWGLEEILPLSDVVISGVPGDKFKVPVHLLREGAVCINFSSEKVRRLHENVDAVSSDNFRTFLPRSRRRHQSTCQRLASAQLLCCCATWSGCARTRRLRQKRRRRPPQTKNKRNE